MKLAVLRLFLFLLDLEYDSKRKLLDNFELYALIFALEQTFIR
jgi:hypothetical protein